GVVAQLPVVRDGLRASWQGPPDAHYRTRTRGEAAARLARGGADRVCHGLCALARGTAGHGALRLVQLLRLLGRSLEALLMPNVLSHEIPLSPAFHDLDPMNVVWHGNYVRYFELARCALLQQIDYDYPQMRDFGYAWPVVDMRIKYVRPLVYGQAVIV